MKRLSSITADDNVLSLAWQDDLLAVTPSTGEISIIDLADQKLSTLPEHALGNGESAWFGGALATCGFDGKIRWNAQEIHAERGMIEHLKTSPDGKQLAAGQGKALLVFDRTGKAVKGLNSLSCAVADFAWNPTDSSQVAVVGAGGARMWKLGADEPFARFDWGGASLLADWSSCGRWLATGDQTSSVHVYDFSRDHPLHIQGYETKVRAMAFSADGTQLATGGGPVITIWPCTGKTGPEGVTPIQLDGHDGDITAAVFASPSGRLATGDGTGCLLIFTFEGAEAKRKRLRLDAGISCLAWHPTKDWLAVGLNDGTATVLALDS